MAQSVSEFTVLDADNKPVKLDFLKNKVVIIVNSATLCGFVAQYQELEVLYQKYKDDGLMVLAFPCNQFHKEDPEPIKDIIADIRSRFGVTYPIFNKVLVNGDNASELFKFLKENKPGKLGFKGVFWNFEKFIIDRSGKPVARFTSEIPPSSFEGLIKRLIYENKVL